MPVHNQFFLESDNAPRKLMIAGPVLPVVTLVPAALEKLLAAKSVASSPLVSGMALIDTGAAKSCVDIRVIRELGVSPIRQVRIGTANGQVLAELFPARFRFSAISMDIEFRSVIGVDLSAQTAGGQPIIALVGRDVLSKCVFTYNGVGGFFTLAL